MGFSFEWWKVFAARLLFVVVFEVRIGFRISIKRNSNVLSKLGKLKRMKSNELYLAKRKLMGIRVSGGGFLPFSCSKFQEYY